MTALLKKMGSYVIVAMLLLAVIFQVFFRYEYLAVYGEGVVRVDRLTGKTCVAWPPKPLGGSGFSCKSN